MDATKDNFRSMKGLKNPVSVQNSDDDDDGDDDINNYNKMLIIARHSAQQKKDILLTVHNEVSLQEEFS
jgi:D-tyrosyl-tRNA(Tyr) deacylase